MVMREGDNLTLAFYLHEPYFPPMSEWTGSWVKWLAQGDAAEQQIRGLTRCSYCCEGVKLSSGRFILTPT